jgi:hypothetical protein
MSHDPSIGGTSDHRVLKAIVIIMGVAIFLGLAVIIATIYNRSQSPKPPANVSRVQSNAPASAASAASAARDFATEVYVPNGELISTSAGDGAVILRYRLLGGSEQLVIIDLRTGNRRGVINLNSGQ